MKRILVLLLIFAGVLLVSCNNNTIVPPQEDKIEVIETIQSVTLRNAYVSVTFDADNGSLKSIINRRSNTDYIKESAGGGFVLTIDTSTANPFHTNADPSALKTISSRSLMMDYSKNVTSDYVTISFVYNIAFTMGTTSFSGISILETVRLDLIGQELLFNYKVTNNCNHDCVITKFTPLIISGIKDDNKDKLALFYPNKEGKIYQNAIAKILNVSGTSQNLVTVYPGLASMQLMQLFNEEESMYYYVKDSTGEYKTLNYGNFSAEGGYDFGEVTSQNRLSMSITQYPFISSTKSKDLHSVVLGVGSKKSWYAGSDSYQQFLRDSDMLNNYNGFNLRWNGFVPLIASHYGDKVFASYSPADSSGVTYQSWIEETSARSGVNTIVVNGWNKGGFDSCYPDYEFTEGLGFGGASGFKQMTIDLHNNGFLIMNHVNSRLCDIASKFASTMHDSTFNYMQLAGIKNAGFRTTFSPSQYLDLMRMESYGSGTLYYVMSPASPLFQNAILDTVQRLRDNGSNGIFFDQLMEKDACLDYDENHKMTSQSTPATLHAEGYRFILSEMQRIGQNKATNPWIIMVGGFGGDYIQKYVDVCVGGWLRKLYGRDDSKDSTLDLIGTEYNDNHIMNPAVIEYTVPGIYIGHAGAGTLSGDVNEYARAFMFGSPFLVEQYTTSTRTLLDTYSLSPDIFYRGIYKDKLGVFLNKDVDYSVILSNNSKNFMVSLHNTSPKTDVTITVDLAMLNIKGTITSVMDCFTGTTYSISNNKLTLQIDFKQFTGLLFTVV